MNLSEFMKTQATEQEPITAPAEKPDFDEVIPEGQCNSTMSRITGRIIKRYGDTNEAKRRFAEKPADYSDLGQAYAFTKFCRDYVRYSPATDYIVYNGVYWEESTPRAQAALDEFTDAQLKEAQPMVEIDHHELNKDGFLLNTPDYTVDLRKGADGKLPHRAEDFITKCTAVAPGICREDLCLQSEAHRRQTCATHQDCLELHRRIYTAG